MSGGQGDYDHKQTIHAEIGEGRGVQYHAATEGDESQGGGLPTAKQPHDTHNTHRQAQTRKGTHPHTGTGSHVEHTDTNTTTHKHTLGCTTPSDAPLNPGHGLCQDRA